MQPATRPKPRKSGGHGTMRIPRTVEDAIHLAGWATYQVARGKMTAEECKALTVLLREFREFLQLDLLVKARERQQQP